MDSNHRPHGQLPQTKRSQVMDIPAYQPVPGNTQEIAQLTDEDSGRNSNKSEATEETEEMVASGNDLGATH